MVLVCRRNLSHNSETVTMIDSKCQMAVTAAAVAVILRACAAKLVQLGVRECRREHKTTYLGYSNAYVRSDCIDRWFKHLFQTVSVASC